MTTIAASWGGASSTMLPLARLVACAVESSRGRFTSPCDSPCELFLLLFLRRRSGEARAKVCAKKTVRMSLSTGELRLL